MMDANVVVAGTDVGDNGGDNNGGKGTGDGGGGGSDNDGFSFGGLGGDDGFFIAGVFLYRLHPYAIVLIGMGSWVLVGAAICLLTSIFAQIFRGAGSPSSRNKKGSRGGVTRTANGSSEIDGFVARMHQGGSLSQASSRSAMRGYSTVSERPSKTESGGRAARCAILFCRALESSKVHYRGGYWVLSGDCAMASGCMCVRSCV